MDRRWTSRWTDQKTEMNNFLSKDATTPKMYNFITSEIFLGHRVNCQWRLTTKRRKKKEEKVKTLFTTEVS